MVSSNIRRLEVLFCSVTKKVKVEMLDTFLLLIISVRLSSQENWPQTIRKVCFDSISEFDMPNANICK